MGYMANGRTWRLMFPCHLQTCCFEPEFLHAVTFAKSHHASPEGLTNFLREEEGKVKSSRALYCLWRFFTMCLAAANVFSLPVFTQEFCGKLMEELENFERANLPKGRPNTMNKGGVSGVISLTAILNASFGSCYFLSWGLTKASWIP